MGAYTDKLYAAMGMPTQADTATGAAIEIGSFHAADTPQLVEEFSATRLRQLLKAHALIDDIDPTLKEAVPLFHTYGDFIKDLKLTETNRSDLTNRWQEQGRSHSTRRPLDHGHSLDRHSASHKGYLAYLQSAEPQLHKFLSSAKPARISQALLRRHTHVVGQPGSGKTELLKSIIAAQINSPAQPTVIIIDPKGEFALQVAKWPEVQDRLVYIDPELDPTHRLQPTLNPFHLDNRTPETIDAAAFQIKDQMGELLASDAALSSNMEALLMPCLALLLSRPNASLEDLMNLMSGQMFSATLLAAGEALSHPIHSRFFKRDFKSKDLEPTKTAVRNRLRALLSSKRFYDLVIGKPTIDIKSLIDSRKVIIFNLRQGKLQESAYQFGRLIVAQLLIHAFARDHIPETQRVPVHCFIDEAHTIFTRSLPIIIDQCRSYGLHLTLAHQRYKQITAAGLSSDLPDSFTIKIAARADGRTQAELATNVGVRPTDLSDLAAGQFFVRVENRPAFKLYGPSDRLGFAHSVTDEQWAKTVKHQLATYYRDTRDLPMRPSKSRPDVPQKTDHQQFMERMQRDGQPFEPTDNASDDDRASEALKPKLGFPNSKSPNKPADTQQSSNVVRPDLWNNKEDDQ